MKLLYNYIIEKLELNKNIEPQKVRDSWDAREFVPGDILDGSFVYNSKHPAFYKVISNNGEKCGKLRSCVKFTQKNLVN